MASHTSRSLLWALLSCLALAQTTDAFAPYSRTQRSNHALSRVFGTASPDGPRPNDSNSDFPPEEDSAAYKGDIDWDGEWKKVVAKQNMPQKRPGKDFYKSDAEIAAIRAANLATEQANKVASNIPQVPEWRSLQGDWKVSEFFSVDAALFSSLYCVDWTHTEAVLMSRLRWPNVRSSLVSA
jgi:hypothetical protein